MKKHLFALLVLVSLLFIITACDDSSDNGATDGDGETKTFMAWVADFKSDAPTAGVEVWVVSEETGEILEDLGSQVSDAEGWVEFTNIPSDANTIGFLCKGAEGQSVDTYQFNIKADAQDEKLWSVDKVTYETAPLAAGLRLDKSKGVVAGAFYWCTNQTQREEGFCAQENEEIVGCGAVATDPVTEDIRYFNDSRLPVALDKRPNVNPLNGYFIGANMAEGKVTLTGLADGEAVGTTPIWSKGNSICIANIYATTDSNPSPEGCE
ncbi:MAG: hypothetical protein C4523_17350 [Myxococcales bacterium]|nr:MAG: hypothetical protein C4523_17350 [Myxococcales bacterium]